MNESTARTVLLIRAIEKNDLQCEILGPAERAEASRWASNDDLTAVPPSSKDGTGPLSVAQELFVARRAQRLSEGLFQSHPLARRAFEATRGQAWVTPALVMVAVCLGLASNALGPEKRINIIAVPVLGMLVWNLAVYLLLIVNAVRSQEQGPLTGSPLHRALVALVMRGARGSSVPREGGSPLLPRSLVAFVEEWIRWGSGLHLARAGRSLHLAAAAFALGVIGGMYWRGLGFEYLAGWESTFLDQDAVEHIVHAVLGPASALTGIELPLAAELARMRAEGSNAADWIHLYAVTAAIFIIVPRILLMVAEVVRERRLQAAFPLPGAGDDYFRRVLSVKRGRGDHVRVLPCGFELAPGCRETLRSVLAALFGLSVNVDYEATLEYGAEEDYLAAPALVETCDYLIVLFNLSSTPEEEIHGRLIDGLVRLTNLGRGAQRLLLILEESSYRRRLSPQAEDRLNERRDAWRRFAAGHGKEIACLDLGLVDPGRWGDEHRGLVEDEREAGA